MKKLYYRYEMEAEFTPAIWNHYVNLRCVPAVNSCQQVYGSRVEIDDADFISRKKDGQGNILVSCRLQDFHSHFRMVSEGIAFVDVNSVETEKPDPCYEFFTEYTRPDENLWSFYREKCEPLFADCRPGWEAVKAMMHALYEAFTYEAGVTSVSTTAAEAFALGKGVCQDYAHILLTLCRMKKIPARYTAGFLNGEGATHAWIEIYDGGYWYGFDPTHDRTITDYYIKVAHGRDACDCPMERGVFRGLTTQSNRVKVIVTEHVHGGEGERYR